MGGLESIVSTLGLSFVSGINLYATVLVVGLAQRFEWIPVVSEDLAILSNPVVLAVAGIFYAAEFFADKIPFVSTVWDGFHTFVRPVGGALLAMGALEGAEPAVKTAALLVGGSVALGSHSTKAGFRMLAHTAPEPTTHSIISIVEDLSVVGLLALMFAYPWVALGVLIALIAGMAVVTPFIWRGLRFLLRSTAGYLMSQRPLDAGELPSWAYSAGPKPTAAYRCYVRRFKGAPRWCPGFLLTGPHGNRFVCKGWFRTRAAELGSRPPQIASRILCDTATYSTQDGSVVLCFTKDWSAAFRSQPSGMTPQRAAVY